MSKLRILRIDDDSERALRAAVEVLLAGGVAAIPTDTVYGLAADATKPEAVAKLAEMKGRSKSQPIAVLVADAAQVEELADEPSAEATALMDAFWPGPLTLVLPISTGCISSDIASAAEILSGGGTAVSGNPVAKDNSQSTPTAKASASAETHATIGVRCPDHSWVRELARRVGPIAATSANLHGMPPCATAEEVVQAFSKTDATAVKNARSKPPEGSVPKIKPALIIDGGHSATAASTVVDCLSPHPEILREGPITQEQLDAALNL